MVDQALHLLEARIRSEEVEVALYLARPAWVRGDAIRLEQVLINLLRNALDAMTDKRYKRLEIRIEPDGELWRLSVLDSGGGIAEPTWPGLRPVLHHQAGGRRAGAGPGHFLRYRPRGRWPAAGRKPAWRRAPEPYPAP